MKVININGRLVENWLKNSSVFAYKFSQKSIKNDLYHVISPLEQVSQLTENISAIVSLLSMRKMCLQRKESSKVCGIALGHNGDLNLPELIFSMKHVTKGKNISL